MPARYAFTTPGRPVVVEFLDSEGGAPGGDAVWAERLLPDVLELLPEWSSAVDAGDAPATVRVERPACLASVSSILISLEPRLRRMMAGRPSASFGLCT